SMGVAMRRSSVASGHSGPETMSPRSTIRSQPRRRMSASTACSACRLPWISETAAIRIAPSPGSEVELDALGQRQRVGVVDRVGLAAHVGAPGVRTGLATATGLLLAAEGTTDLGARGPDVDVGDAAVGAGGRQEGLGALEVGGEDRRG